MKNTSLITSFSHAVRGFVDAFKRERNLRIHIAVADLITPFAAVYGIDRIGFAVLVVAITVVISAELFNSAVEKAVDTATKEYRSDAKHSKDFAAAATLVCAVGAVLCGVCLFGDAAKIAAALIKIFTDVRWLSLFAVIFTADIFIVFYPFFMRKHIKRP